MRYKYFSRNGLILPIDQAVIPLSNIAYQYGFGVYETIRMNKGVIYFTDEHLERLQQSAQTLGLEYAFSNVLIGKAITELIKKNEAETCNIKLLLIGGVSKDQAKLYILCLNPLFPDRKLYAQGCNTITCNAERPFPHAKSLNMLQSYIAYREAKANSAYDALLIDRHDHITEGTRTNFFCLKGKTIVSPPEDKILLGVMRKVVLSVAQAHGFNVEERDISLPDLDKYDGSFLTNTSSKIMPIKSINKHIFTSISPDLKELMRNTDEFLKNCGGKLNQC